MPDVRLLTAALFMIATAVGCHVYLRSAGEPRSGFERMYWMQLRSAVWLCPLLALLMVALAFLSQ